MNKLNTLPDHIQDALHQSLPQGAKLLYISVVGSTLYGTNNENSDTDYRGVYLPSIEALVKQERSNLESIKISGNSKTKNTKDDIDFELWSLHDFLGLLQKGETNAYDLLYSTFREDTIIYSSPEFNYIQSNTNVFLAKNTKAFTGYCVSQAKKYGVKGSRYKELMSFKTLDLFPRDTEPDHKLQDYIFDWDLSKYEYIQIVKGEGTRDNKLMYLEVLGRKFIQTMKVQEFINHILKIEKQYGDRTKTATEGVDWKALSHAVRVLTEVEELLEDGKITLPLKQKDLVKGIKYGHLTLKETQDIIEFLLTKIDYLTEKSEFPDRVNKEIVNDIIMRIYRMNYDL